MQDQDKTKDQLIDELNEMRRKLAEAKANQHSSREGGQHTLESEIRLRLALEAARVVVWEWDLKTGRAIWEETHTGMLGYEPNELKPSVRTWKRHVHPDEWEKVSEALNKHLSGRLPSFDVEYRVRNKAGQFIWIQSRGKVVEHDKDGKPLRMRGTNVDVTELRRATEELKRKIEEQEILLNTIDIQVWYLTDPKTHGLANQSHADFLGKRREEIEGKRLDDFLSHDVADVCELGNREVFQSGRTVHTEEWIPNASGEPRLIAITKTPKLDEYGKVEYVVCSGTDITERKRTEQEVLDSKERYQSLYRMIRLMCDNVPDLIWAKDMERSYLFVNRSHCEKLLIANDTTEPIGKDDMYFVERERKAHPDDPNWHTFGEICIDSDAVIMSTKKPQRFDEPGNVKGQFLYFDVYKAPFLNEQGEMIGTVGCGRDVTEEKRIKDSLQESESRYRELFHYASDLIYTHDMEGNYTSVNQAANTLLGYTEDEFLKLHFRDIVAPESVPIIEENFFKKIRDGIEITGPYEALVRSKNGAPIWLEIKSRSIKQGGNPVGIHGIARNITDRKALEKALFQAQATYRSVVEAFDGIIHVSSPDHVIEFANQRLIDRTGYDPVGEKCFKVVHGLEDVCPWCKYREEDPEATFKGERLSPKDNRWYYVVSSPFYHEDGSLSRIFLMHDLDMQKKAETERENLREQLLQAQKMEAVGTLAGGIAHDFNNLLQVVLGYSEVMLLCKKEVEHDYAGLQNIYQAGKRGADLVKSLMTFSRKVETQYVSMDLNQEIAAVRDLLFNTIPKTITIDIHLSENLSTIEADKSQISQILMNLGVNARDAMPDGGTLTIETANIQLDEEYCGIHPETKPGNYVLLTVSDTGQGMDKETLSHIFEPFFTTKEHGKGTGLGLATVYGIVKGHGGYINCNSELGQGTTFNIYLPTIQTDQILETSPIETTTPGGNETILLVEDNDMIRELCAELLVGVGYNVISTGNGKEALEIFQKDKDRISLILLDLIMPVMDGWQCLVKILRIDPKAKVIIASGYIESGLAKGMQAKGAMGIVHKPFESSQLLTTIRKVLDKD